MKYEETKLTTRDQHIGRAPKKQVSTKIVVQDGARLGRKAAKRTLKQTLRVHRHAIRQLRHDIRRHKLLARQARLTYKITK